MSMSTKKQHVEVPRPSLDLLIKSGCFDVRQPDNTSKYSAPEKRVTDERAREIGRRIRAAASLV